MGGNEKSLKLKTQSEKFEVAAWNFTYCFKDVEREILARPVYRVMEATFYKGAPTSEGEVKQVASGTATYLQTMCPLGTVDDPLTTQNVLDLETRRWFEFKNSRGQWLWSSDPRRSYTSNKGLTEERPVNSLGEYLASRDQVRTLVTRFTLPAPSQVAVAA